MIILLVFLTLNNVTQHYTYTLDSMQDCEKAAQYIREHTPQGAFVTTNCFRAISA